MTEWEVVGVLVVLVGLFIAVGSPIIKYTKDNTKVMTELTEAVKALTKDLTDLEKNNTDAHRRIWQHNDKQDEQLADHEKRITVLERDAD